MFKQLTGALLATTLLASPVLAAEGLSEKADKAAHQAKDAVAGTSISNLGESGDVTVSGTVSYVDSLDNEFTVKDDTGSIDVEQQGKLNVAVGDKVTVTGAVSEDMGEKEIAASKVTVDKKGEDKTSQNLN